MINIIDFGAVGDGRTLCTNAFDLAVKAAKQNRDTVLVPSGVFLTGTINLDGVSLHIQRGAVIKASSDIRDYPDQDYVHNELGVLTALIFSLGGEGILIDGGGTIDLSGKSFFDVNSPIIPESRVPFSEKQIAECTLNRETRPSQSIFFDKVKDICVKDITVLDSPCWTFTFTDCENVRVSGLTVRTDMNVPNDDGMHFCSCKDVRITDCNISSGDDCIAISGITDWEKPCENIVISDCILETRSKAIALGYIYSHVRNVLIENVIVRGSNRGLCFMSNPECGLVENVRIKNMIIDTRIAAGNWWGNGEPIFFMAVKHDFHIPPEQKPSRITEVNFKNIHIEGISCTAENAAAIVGTGSNYQDVYISDVDIALKESENLPLKGRIADIAPSPDTVEIPENCALYIKNATGVYLDNIRTGSLSVICE